jgi:hypothetical protein
MVDWNFQPNSSSRQSDYAVYYPRELENKEDIFLIPGQNFQYDHLGAVFNGNTSASITVQFSKDNDLILTCAHIMSSLVDGRNPFLSKEEQTVALLSDLNLINATNVYDSNHLFPEIFGDEPDTTHCYYFEKADLAYQLKEWQLAIDIYNKDIIIWESNWIDTELVPIIGSYAHIGDWNNAYSFSITMSDRSYYPISSVICELWKSLDKDTPDGFQKKETIQAVTDRFDCQN